MPLNGSGTFEPKQPEYPAIPDTTILASDWNEILQDIATALSTALYRDGQAAATANISMGSHKLTNLTNGSDPQDATTFLQVFTNPTFTGTSGTGVVLAGTKATVSATIFDVNSTTVDIDGTDFTLDSNDFQAVIANIFGVTADSIELEGVFSVLSATSATINADDVNLIGVTSVDITAPTITLTGTSTIALSSTSTVPNLAITDDSTKVVNSHFVQQMAIQSAVPTLTGHEGKVLTVSGTDAIWSDLFNVTVMNFADGTDPTKRASLILSGITAGQDRQITVPNADFTITGNDLTQTLKNKTIEQNDSLFQLFANGAATKKALFDLALITAGQTRTAQIADENMLLFTPARRLLQTFTASGSTTTFDMEPTVFDNTYERYELEIDNITVATNLTALDMLFKVGGSYLTAAYYQTAQTGNTAAVNNGAAGHINGSCSNAAAAAIDLTIKIPRPFDTAKNKAIYFAGQDRQAAVTGEIGGYIVNSNTGALQGLRIQTGSGNILSATARLYGIRKT